MNGQCSVEMLCGMPVLCWARMLLSLPVPPRAHSLATGIYKFRGIESTWSASCDQGRNITIRRNATAIAKMVLSPKGSPPSQTESGGSTAELTWPLMWWGVLTCREVRRLLFPPAQWRGIRSTTKTQEDRNKAEYLWGAFLTWISARTEMHVPFADHT